MGFLCLFLETKLTNLKLLLSKLWLINCKLARITITFLIARKMVSLRYTGGVCSCCSNLDGIAEREVCCYMISCKDSVNIDIVIDWLIKHSRTAKWWTKLWQGKNVNLWLVPSQSGGICACIILLIFYGRFSLLFPYSTSCFFSFFLSIYWTSSVSVWRMYIL